MDTTSANSNDISIMEAEDRLRRAVPTNAPKRELIHIQYSRFIHYGAGRPDHTVEEWSVSDTADGPFCQHPTLRGAVELYEAGRGMRVFCTVPAVTQDEEAAEKAGAMQRPDRFEQL